MVRSGDFLRVPFFLRKNGHESIDSLYTLREFALACRALQHVNGVEAGGYEIGPVGDGEVGGAESVAVSSFAEDVEFGRDFEVFEGAIVDEGVLDVDGIVLGLEEEGGGGVGAGGGAGGEDAEGGFGGEVAGVDNDGEVRPGADPAVDCTFEVLAPRFEAGVVAEDYGEMASGGEAEEADLIGVDVRV